MHQPTDSHRTTKDLPTEELVEYRSVSKELNAVIASLENEEND